MTVEGRAAEPHFSCLPHYSEKQLFSMVVAGTWGSFSPDNGVIEKREKETSSMAGDISIMKKRYGRRWGGGGGWEWENYPTGQIPGLGQEDMMTLFLPSGISPFCHYLPPSNTPYTPPSHFVCVFLLPGSSFPIPQLLSL